MKNKIEKRIAELEIMEMQNLTTLASIRGAKLELQNLLKEDEKPDNKKGKKVG
jgi:hypothetical protein